MEHARGTLPARERWARVLPEAAFAAVAAVALFAAGSTLQLPVVLFLLSPLTIVCPVPLVLVTIRQGPLAGGVMVGGAAAVLAAAHIPGASALVFLLAIGVPAAVMGVCMRRNVGQEWTVLLGAAALCAAFALMLGIQGGGGGGIAGAYREALAEIDRGLREAQQLSEAVGAPGEAAALAEGLASLWGLAQRPLPGLVAALSIVMAAAVSVLAMALAARTVGTATPAFAWALPEGLVWGFIAAAGATLAPWGPWRPIGFNALLVILSLYFLQGLSIVGFFFRRLELPWYVRSLAAFTAMLWPPLTLLVVGVTVGVGICDVWVAFRRADTPRPSGTAR